MNQNDLMKLFAGRYDQLRDQALAQLLEEVYQRGFADGVSSLGASKGEPKAAPKAEPVKITPVRPSSVVTSRPPEPSVKWVDLGLPSGTLWAYAGEQPYPAAEYTNFIPTYQDFDELSQLLIYTNDNESRTIKGANGILLGFRNTKAWVLSPRSSTNTQETVFFDTDDNTIRQYHDYFQGANIALLFCKRK